MMDPTAHRLLAGILIKNPATIYKIIMQEREKVKKTHTMPGYNDKHGRIEK
jgi:hypothetical protein